jgi:AcrR family transcriptional regulator
VSVASEGVIEGIDTLYRQTDRGELREIPYRSDRRFTLRREELADATIRTLSEVGYARASLREIAQSSGFSHGVLHYYFRDKNDLIICSVRRYKDRCIRGYDGVIAGARSFAELEEGFLAGLGSSVRNDAPLQRLWFELRAQALFDDTFRDDVIQIDRQLSDMFLRITTRLRELAGASQIIPDVDMYALYDGIFQHALLRHVAGDAAAVYDMKANMSRVLRLSLGKPYCLEPVGRGSP